MKKLFKLAFVMLCALSSLAFGQKKPGWAIAAVDGGGALAGAAAVVEISAGGAVAAGPWGWAAIGLGGVIGGAAASAGFAYSRTTNQGTSENPRNEYDMVGIKHNQIVIDYFEFIGEKNVTAENYVEFIDSTESELYNEVKHIITKEYLSKQFEEIRFLDELQLLNWTISKLPNSVDREKFTIFFNEYKNSKNKELAINHITNYENEIISSNMDKIDKAIMQCYFTTMRNSTLLWENISK